jgi:flagellin
MESAAFLAANKLVAKNAAIAASAAAGGDATAQAAAGTAAESAMTSNKLDISSSTALTTISAAIDKVSGYKAEWGAGQNRLEYTVSNLMNVVEFTAAARSRIQDADFAAEAAKLAKAQVLQQTGAAMLAQANAAPQLALQLIK